MKKVVLLFISLFFIASASDIKIDILDIGGKSIKIPEPVGLKEISYIEELKPLSSRLGATGNKVLAVYVSTNYIKSFPNIKDEYPDMWATIVVDKNIQNTYFNVKAYKDAIESIKNHNVYENIGSRFDNEVKVLNKGLKKDYGVDFNLTLNVPKLIPGQSLEEDSYYSFLSLIKTDGKTLVGSTAIVHIYHRIFSINVYKEYHSNKDIDNLKKEFKLWLNDIVKLNKKVDEITCDKGNISDCYGLGIITARGDDGVKKDVARAVELFGKACDASHAKACFELGKLYTSGSGVQKNDVKAKELFNKACDGGSNGACYNLGAIYGTGALGVKQDNHKASQYYQKACDNGDTHACFNLGTFYSNGLGVKQNYLKAIEYYTKACDGGYISGCNNLGMAYKESKGVKRDYSKALGFFKTACDANHAQGCVNLGSMYYYGQGVKTNMGIVKELMLKACEGGSSQACINYKTLK